MVVLLFEAMHVVGLALLFYVVLPELDVVKGAMLTNCVAFIPAVFGKFEFPAILIEVRNSIKIAISNRGCILRTLYT